MKQLTFVKKGRLEWREEPDPVLESCLARNLMHELIVVPQYYVQFRISQRQASYHFNDVTQFSRNGAQELLAHRRVEKQMARLDARSA